MSLSRTIKAKLTLAFALVLAIALMIGILGVTGNQKVGRQLLRVNGIELPKSELFTRLALNTTELSGQATAYQLQPFYDQTRNDGILADAGEVSALVAETQDEELQIAFEEFSSELAAALGAHETSAELFLVFEDNRYALRDFLNRVAVENAHYFSELNRAARFRRFDGIEADPDVRSFAVLMRSYALADTELQALAADYQVREAEVFSLVAGILSDPENGANEVARLNARPVPKLDRALKNLSDAVEAETSARAARKVAAIESFRVAGSRLVALAQDRRKVANSDMQAALLEAAGLGQSVTRNTFVILCVGMLITLLAMLYAARSVGTPLARLSRVLARLGQDEADIDVPYQHRGDEIGAVAAAAETFRLGLIERWRLEDQEAARQRQEIRDREAAAAAELERQEREHQEREKSAQEQADLKENLAREHAEEQERIHRERQKDHDRQKLVVGELATALQKLATGNLDAAIDTPFADIYEELRGHFNGAVQRMADIVSEISSSAGIVTKTTLELSTSFSDLSKRTEGSAATLEETSVSLSELTSTVKSTSSLARNAEDQATQAQVQAREGSDQASVAVAAIDAIEASSQHISQIVGVIDGISFQTNLLALNAGVEAARAGDAGRGFAVVASEVRALAQRSTEAAREINDLIASSSEQVKRGSELVRQTGNNLDSIATSTTKAAELISEITQASGVQSQGLAYIDTAVGDLDRDSQRNAAMLDENTAAVAALREQSERLVGAISKFQTHGHTAAGPGPKTAQSGLRIAGE